MVYAVTILDTVYNGSLTHFTFWISASLSEIAERNRCKSQASRSNDHGYLPKYLLFIVIILEQKGVMQTYGLQTFECNIFAKLSPLDVCKPTRLHRSFLL